MGPMALFDKSFLQSLSVDESVWFDHLFMAVVCPLFYIETLADLAKSPNDRRKGEDLVRIIASKFPEVGGSPCAEHSTLIVNNFLGFHLPLDGRIPRPGGRNVRSGTSSGAVFQQSPEEEAFSRWQKQDFQEIERKHAQVWRANLNNLGLGAMARRMQEIGIDGQKFKSLEEVRKSAADFVTSRGPEMARLALAVEVFRIPQEYHRSIIKRWLDEGKPALRDFAPYVSYALEVEIFFYFALGANLISSERASNRIDISYLYYLPFCYVFVSGDKLHQKTAPLFLRGEQKFIWGPDLKSDLAKINAHYLQLPKEVREKGLHHFGTRPPSDGNFLVSALWDHFMRPDWRDDKPFVPNRERDKEFVAELKKFTNAPTSSSTDHPMPDDIDHMSISRLVKRQKGSWWQIGKNIKDDDDDGLS